MREPGQEMMAPFPRPGRALRAILITIAALALVGAIVVNWAPGGTSGAQIFQALAFEPSKVLSRPWGLLTSGLLTSPIGFSHAMFSLMGLYFLTTDLESRWGSARLLRFLAASVVLGNVVVLAVAALPIHSPVFHPGLAFGPLAAITATALAWSKENAEREIRLFFFLPIRGRTLFWVTIGFSVLALIFLQDSHEGAVAPFGGIAAGLLLGGSPSPMRSLWLHAKLALLRRKGDALTVESLAGLDRRPRSAKRPTKGGPPLRVVQGGLEDDPTDRKPPKDKRYLN